MMVLVDLLVYDRCDFFASLRADLFLDNRITNILIDGGIMLAILGEKLGYGLLCFIHFEMSL